MKLQWCVALCLALPACTADAGPPGASGPRDSEPHAIATIEIGRSYSIAAGPTGIWSANYDDGEVVRVDPDTNEVSATVGVRKKLGNLEDTPRGGEHRVPGGARGNHLSGTAVVVYKYSTKH